MTLQLSDIKYLAPRQLEAKHQEILDTKTSSIKPQEYLEVLLDQWRIYQTSTINQVKDCIAHGAKFTIELIQKASLKLLYALQELIFQSLPHNLNIQDVLQTFASKNTQNWNSQIGWSTDSQELIDMRCELVNKCINSGAHFTTPMVEQLSLSDLSSLQDFIFQSVPQQINSQDLLNRIMSLWPQTYDPKTNKHEISPSLMELKKHLIKRCLDNGAKIKSDNIWSLKAEEFAAYKNIFANATYISNPELVTTNILHSSTLNKDAKIDFLNTLAQAIKVTDDSAIPSTLSWFISLPELSADDLAKIDLLKNEKILKHILINQWLYYEGTSHRSYIIELDKIYYLAESDFGRRSIVNLLSKSKDEASELADDEDSPDQEDNDMLIQEGLKVFADDPTKFQQAKYKNLETKPGNAIKIPLKVHHIWLTHPDNPKELREEDIAAVLRTDAILKTSPNHWEHIVWVFRKDLSPESTKFLEEHGIKVREVSKIHQKLVLPHIFYKMLVNKVWGMASDILRVEILNMEDEGGFYWDLNYNLNRPLDEEAHTFDYFTQSFSGFYIDNFFFAAKPGHPILKEWLKIIERNFCNPPQYIQEIQKAGSVSKMTDTMTANPSAWSYYKKSNMDGNIDVVYPSNPEEIMIGAENCTITTLHAEEAKNPNPICIAPSEDRVYQQIHVKINEWSEKNHGQERSLGEKYIPGTDGSNGRTWDTIKEEEHSDAKPAFLSGLLCSATSSI